MKFYDPTLNPNIKFARHAISIDEARPSFQRVPWGGSGNKETSFAQLWFAGCHSDVGGSYPRTNRGLSDISLQWMLHAATGGRTQAGCERAAPLPRQRRPAAR
jgi:uncharacterized protein (DUF2235 family)